ncbi:MAG: PAS domain S-box protein [Deltaproteobacteria bacterium]|nr:PAS domain S-box protein [Deltaproteobacteria bacterium]
MDEERTKELSHLRAEVGRLERALAAVQSRPDSLALAQQLDALVRLNTEAPYRGPSLAEAARATLELAATTLSVDRASFWLLENGRDVLRCVDLFEQARGLHSAGSELRARDFPAYFSAVLSERAVAAHDAETDPRTSEFTEGYLRPLGIRSMLDAAIRQQGETLGVICLEQTGTARTWNLDEVSFAGQIADHLSRVVVEAERQRAVEERLESEKNYREIFDATSDALFLHDDTGRIVDVNERVCAMFGCDRETALSLDIEGLSEGNPPYSVADAVERVKAALVEGPQTFEWRSRRADGTLFWSEVSLKASLIGGERRVIASVRDISARKEAQAARRSLEAQLQQATKMEAVGRLAGGIAHDFNNLLTAIGFSIELARMEAARGNPIEPPLEEALKSTQRAAELTRQLLAFSRQQVVEPRVIELNALVRDVDKMLARLIGENITLSLTLAEGAGNVKADPAQLEQVLVNLAVNARDAMPSGGRLELHTDRVTLSPAQRDLHPDLAPGPFLRLRVSDTGHGMSEEVQAHIFEPFFTTKPTGEGTGLGLSMIFGTVQQAGGFIEVSSEVGVGTTFALYFPRLETAAGATRAATKTGTMPGGDETILLLEDEERLGKMACTLLERLGYTILHAETGAGALALMDQRGSGVDLLLTDVVLPDTNGRQVAETLTARDPAMKVIFVSGYTEDVVLRHGVSEERFRFLAKPYSMRTLAAKVREVLDED